MNLTIKLFKIVIFLLSNVIVVSSKLVKACYLKTLASENENENKSESESENENESEDESL